MIGGGIRAGKISSRCVTAILAIIVLAPLPAAAAGVIILNHSYGRECYVQTLAESSPDNNDRGLAICTQAISESGDDRYNHAAALVNRADIRLRLPDYPGALADADAAIALEPAIAEAYANRGAALIGEKRFAEALTALDKALELESPKSEIAYYNRALVKEAVGDIKGAYLDFKAASDLNPRFGLATEQLARFQVIRR